MRNRPRQNNKGAHRIRKIESNDSTEIPDRGETSDVSGLPSGLNASNETNKMVHMYKNVVTASISKIQLLR